MKIPDHVNFTQNICIPNTEHPIIEYRLISMIIHTGRWLDSGHYLAYFKEDDDWKEANDRYIRTVDWDIVKEKQAFVLFYERLDILNI